MKGMKGIEVRAAASGLKSYRAVVKRAGVKRMGPWTTSLGDAQRHRLEILGRESADEAVILSARLSHLAGELEMLSKLPIAGALAEHLREKAQKAEGLARLARRLERKS